MSEIDINDEYEQIDKLLINLRDTVEANPTPEECRIQHDNTRTLIFRIIKFLDTLEKPDNMDSYIGHIGALYTTLHYLILADEAICDGIISSTAKLKH